MKRYTYFVIETNLKKVIKTKHYKEVIDVYLKYISCMLS